MNLLQKLKKAFSNPLSTLSYLLGINFCYSQTGEDLILQHIFKKKGFYIDIGANHPTHYNNTYMLYKNGRHGINIEPNKELINKFNSKRPRDINLQLACGDSSEQSAIIFYSFFPNTLSTCDKESAKKYQEMGHTLIDTYSVPVMSITDIIEKYGSLKEIDVLSVDVEGHDLNVLKTNNWKKYRPNYVILETLEYKHDGTGKKLNNIYDSLFEDRGYEKFADTYINTIYKRN